MDLSDDEDMFALSDDEIPQPPVLKANPIEENLITELSSMQKRIDRTKTDIQEFQSSIEKVLKQFAHVAKYGEELDVDVGGEWFTISGEPIIKPVTPNVLRSKQPLTIRNLGQYIVDDKWIILVNLRNTSSWHLEDLRFYICLKNDNELSGTSAFWTLVDNSFWNTVEVIQPKSDLIIASVVLDVPTFEEELSLETCGTILYKADDKPYQSVVPNFELAINRITDESYTVDFENDAQISILVMKTVSVEQTVSFNIRFPNAGLRFLELLEKYHFVEVIDDVRLIRNVGSLKYGILEILAITDSEMKIKVSAGSPSQLSIILTLLRQDFPDIPGLEKEEDCLEAANVLLKELELLISNETPAKIQRAKVNSDLLIS